MSVHYLQKGSTVGINDTFGSLLRNCQEEFKAQQVNIFGDGFRDILSDDALYNRYVDLLAGEMDDDSANTFKTISQNNRQLALEGASLGSVVPFSSLATPMIRKSWARLAMPKALPTEAVESPKFTITYMTPWVRGQDGVKRRVPDDLLDFDEAVSRIRLGETSPVYLTSTALANGTPTGFQSVSLFSGFTLDAMGNNTSTAWMSVADEAVRAKYYKSNDQLSVNASISKVGFAVPTTGGAVEYDGTVHTLLSALTLNSVALTAADLVKVTNIVLDTRSNSFKALVRLEVEVDKACIDTTAATSTVKIYLLDTIFGDLDIQTGRFTVTSVAKKILSANIKAFISSVMNNYNTEVGFDVDTKEIHIGDGEHISAPIPNEYVTDLLRTYQFNGVTKLVDIMSNTIAQKLDLTGIQFIDDEIADFLDQIGNRFVQKFNVKPVGSFVGSPSEWKKEVRDLIDYVADDIINMVHFDTGYFVILANPLDAHILPEVSWTFQGGSNTEISGVAAKYSYGSFQGIHSYNLVSSPNVPQGYLRLYWIPTTEDQMTMKFFPYSFTVEQPGSGYNNPNAQLVPSLMSHRRYTFEKVLRANGKIVITNNDYTHRSLAGQSPYLPTQTEV